MKIPYQALPKLRLASVLVFLIACALFFAYLWVNMGGKIPGITRAGYQVNLQLTDANNLVSYGDVRIAGVRVGKVQEVESSGPKAHVVIQLDPDVAPLHAGATVRVGAKTLVEESYVAVVDGDGPAIPSGGTLPASAVKPGVQLDDVIRAIDPQTRESLSSALRSFGRATQGRGADVSDLAAGLGDVGRGGHDALSALAAQSKDLVSMTRGTTTLLRALDTRQGQIATLVRDSQRLTAATAAGRKDLETTMKKLPRVMGTARDATAQLVVLSDSLAPVAKDLDEAAPLLSPALGELPATSRDLRSLLPALNGTLDAVPATLSRIPTFGRDSRAIIPEARVALSDINPMLGYLQPYGRDIAALFANMTDMFSQRDVNGHYLRAFAIFNEQTVRNFPLNTNTGILDKSNAYPQPGEAAHPGPYDGTYTHVKREPE